MMLCVGSVVKSMAGHDKDKFFCIVERNRDSVKLANGKQRKLEQPKTKNIKHIQATATRLDLTVVNTNKQLRGALRSFHEGEA